MLSKYYWIVLYTVHVTAFCLGGPFFLDTVYISMLTEIGATVQLSDIPTAAPVCLRSI